MDQRIKKIELSSWFPGSLLFDENIASGFPYALGSWDELDIKLSLLEWSAWIRCALAPLFCISAASGLPESVGLREDLESLRARIYIGEASIFSSFSIFKIRVCNTFCWVVIWMHLWLDAGHLGSNFSKLIYIFTNGILVVISHNSFRCLIRVGLSQDSCQAQFF